MARSTKGDVSAVTFGEVTKTANRESHSSPEVLVLLSGGLDSAACLHFFIEIGRPVAGLFIDYQQQAVKQEYSAAKAIANYYDVTLYAAEWRGQTTKGLGFVAARNAFLLVAALMESPETITTISLGIHAGTNYVDCSSGFVQAMQGVFDLYTEGALHIAVPFIDWDKAYIWKYAQSNNMPINLTYSCESGEVPPCGRCLSCLDREKLATYA